MRLTRAATYALHAVAYMAGQPKKDHPIASHIIAQRRGIPERFLLKVLKPLVSAQVLFSVKGPNGGYGLARSANDITVLDILEAVDGPLRGQAPSGLDAENHNSLQRRLDQICAQSAALVRKQLGKIKIADLAMRE